jgi:hypothetical protein
MPGTARMQLRQTGQRKNKNVREADPKPRGKKTRNRGTKSKPVPKEDELGTLFDEVEVVDESLQFLNPKELKSCAAPCLVAQKLRVYRHELLGEQDDRVCGGRGMRCNHR